jgi:hypothetical protein
MPSRSAQKLLHLYLFTWTRIELQRNCMSESIQIIENIRKYLITTINTHDGRDLRIYRCVTPTRITQHAISGSSAVCRCLDVTVTDSSAVTYEAIGNHLSVCNRLTVTTPSDKFLRNSVEVHFVSRCRATSVRSVHIGSVTVVLQLRAQMSVHPSFPCFCTDMGESMYIVSPHVGQFCVPKKGKSRPSLLYTFVLLLGKNSVQKICMKFSQ